MKLQIPVVYLIQRKNRVIRELIIDLVYMIVDVIREDVANYIELKRQTTFYTDSKDLKAPEDDA